MTTRWIAASLALVALLVGFAATDAFTKDEDDCPPVKKAKPAPAKEAGEQPTMSEEEMWAQMMQLGQPGAHHEHLEPLAGNFSADTTYWMKGEATKSTGVSRGEWILGGRFLRMEFEGSFGGMPYEGGGLLGYDNHKKQYQSVWVDNMSSGITWSTGSSSEDGKVITLRGEFDSPMGKFPVRMAYTIHDENSYTVASWSTYTGEEVQEMEIKLTRVE